MISFPKQFQASEYVRNLVGLTRLFVERAKVKPRTSRLEYARTIVIPNGPHAGSRYTPDRQPICELILKEFDRDFWPVFLFMWSVQSGKSFVFVNFETCYIAEVLQEDQVVALPDDSMARSKWAEIREIFIAKGSADLLPKQGPGSKDGSLPNEVRFANGARIKFMTSGASDAGRSGFTARHVCVDEIDKQTKTQSTSQETSPVKQYEGRQKAFQLHRRRFRGTSTIGEEGGFLWTSWEKGSKGLVLKRCHHCGKWVFPERKHLQGWQNATNELEAMKLGYIVCPECNGPWNEDQRIDAVRNAVIVHAGQTIDDAGIVRGELPPTTVGAVRANGFDDILGKSIADISRQEFIARKSGNPPELELEIDQHFFAVPKKSASIDSVPLTMEMIVEKPMAETRRYRAPDDVTCLILGVDMHSTWAKGVLAAKVAGGNIVIVDYFEMDSGWEVFDEKIGKRRVAGLETEGRAAWFRLLDRLFDRCFREGWDFGDERIFPGRVYIDSRYNHPNSKAIDDVYVIDQWLESLDWCRFAETRDAEGKKHWECRFCKHRETGEHVPENRICAIRTNPDGNGRTHRDLFRMVMGVGKSERDRRTYSQRKGKSVLSAGTGWHQVFDADLNRTYWMFDADRSKLQVQNRFFRPVDTPGTMLLYRVDNSQEHTKYGLSITAKKQVTIKGKTEWVEEREDDHALDATGIACVGLEIESESSIDQTVDSEVIKQEIEASTN